MDALQSQSTIAQARVATDAQARQGQEQPAIAETTIEEMVIEQTDAITNGSSAMSVASSNHIPRSWWLFAKSTSAVPPAMSTESNIQPSSLQPTPAFSSSSAYESVPVSAIESISFVREQRSQQPSSSATWFGVWPWNSESTSSRPAKTEAELIKEEAMAREKGKFTLSSPPSSSKTLNTQEAASCPQNVERNPIADDILDNRSSWATFFSRRAAHGAKRIALEDEGDVEVMDLSADPDMPPASPAPTSPVNLAITKAKGKGAAPGRSSSLGPAKKGVEPKTNVADSAKVRSASVTPSKRSIAPPSGPKPPNMVLPTFEETFYTLPRALPPYTRPTSLKRVGKLVSGVFGINGENAPSARRKSEMREWQQKMGVEMPRDYEGLRASRDVGRDFPRVGEVLGINDVGGLRNCKRVAILGVHGCVLP